MTIFPSKNYAFYLFDPHTIFSHLRHINNFQKCFQSPSYSIPLQPLSIIGHCNDLRVLCSGKVVFFIQFIYILDIFLFIGQHIHTKMNFVTTFLTLGDFHQKERKHFFENLSLSLVVNNKNTLKVVKPLFETTMKLQKNFPPISIAL